MAVTLNYFQTHTKDICIYILLYPFWIFHNDHERCHVYYFKEKCIHAWDNWGSIRFNTLRPRQNGHNFADDTFKRIFMNENVKISINISLNFVPNGLINNIPALVQIMAWRLPGNKPLSEPMMVNLLTHICVLRPQWVNDDIAHT